MLSLRCLSLQATKPEADHFHLCTFQSALAFVSEPIQWSRLFYFAGERVVFSNHVELRQLLRWVSRGFLVRCRCRLVSRGLPTSAILTCLWLLSVNDTHQSSRKVRPLFSLEHCVHSPKHRIADVPLVVIELVIFGPQWSNLVRALDRATPTACLWDGTDAEPSAALRFALFFWVLLWVWRIHLDPQISQSVI